MSKTQQLPRNGAGAPEALAPSLDASWLRCPRTVASLRRLDQTLHAAITADDIQMRMMALDLIGRGGKRLRPALLFLVGTFGKAQDAELQPAAAAMELFHVASLYHDDVMDRAPQRRKGNSVNQRWGNLGATLAGAYLFARATMLLATLGNRPNQIASEAAEALCLGQLQEVENAFNLALEEATYMQIIARKTATMFETPCRLGAFLSNISDEKTNALQRYGRNLGLAFQLADDALDLVGDADKTGKRVGTDLREGVYSLPVLRALHQGGDEAVALRALLLRSRMRDEDVQQATRLIRACGTVDETLALARDYGREAQEALKPLPAGHARESLWRLADFAVARSS